MRSKNKTTTVPQGDGLSVPYSETGLSAVFQLLYTKAVCLLANSENVVKAPGDYEGFLKASDSSPTPYFVAVKQNGACIWQYEGFKLLSLCSHSLAMAEKIGKLDQYLVWFHS